MDLQGQFKSEESLHNDFGTDLEALANRLSSLADRIDRMSVFLRDAGPDVIVVDPERIAARMARMTMPEPDEIPPDDGWEMPRDEARDEGQGSPDMDHAEEEE
jgi:hypothetical protein